MFPPFCTGCNTLDDFVLDLGCAQGTVDRHALGSIRQHGMRTSKRYRFVTTDQFIAAVGAPLVDTALAGINTCCLTYGHSGSGKTFTMKGSPRTAASTTPTSGSTVGRRQQGDTLRGLMPRMFEKLFRDIRNTDVLLLIPCTDCMLHTQSISRYISCVAHVMRSSS